MRIHVVHITNNCNRGGANHVLLPIIKELSNKDIKFTLAYLKGPELLKDEFESLGVNTILLGKNPIRILIKLLKLVKNKDKSKTIFHTHLVQAGLIGRFFGLISRIPIITTRHYQERGKKNNLLYILEDLTIRWNTFVVAISNSVKEYLINSKYIHEHKCIRIYNPLNDIFADNDKKLSKDHFNITCVGRLHPVKGIHYLIEAFEEICIKIPNAKLIIIGRDDGLGKNIIKKIDNHPYKNKIYLPGFLTSKEIKGALSKTNVYVQPSLNEGLGIAAIEAMAMGCPCVFSNVGGLVELAKKGRNALLVPSKNSQKIVESVLWYYNNINESEKIAKNGKQYILNNFNSKLIADQYYRLYKQILK